MYILYILMARYVGAKNQGSETVMVFRTVARNKRMAKVNAAVSFFGRRPGKIPGLEDIEAFTLSDGMLHDYTVEIKLDQSQDLKSKLRGEKIAHVLESNL